MSIPGTHAHTRMYIFFFRRLRKFKCTYLSVCAWEKKRRKEQTINMNKDRSYKRAPLSQRCMTRIWREGKKKIGNKSRIKPKTKSSPTSLPTLFLIY